MGVIGVRIAALGLALAVLCPSPQACAFGLRLGPFLFGVRAHHHHHYRYVVRRQTEAVRRPTEGLHPKATPTDDVARVALVLARRRCPGSVAADYGGSREGGDEDLIRSADRPRKQKSGTFGAALFCRERALNRHDSIVDCCGSMTVRRGEHGRMSRTQC